MARCEWNQPALKLLLLAGPVWKGVTILSIRTDAPASVEHPPAVKLAAASTLSLVRRFWITAAGFWRGPLAWKARLLTFLLIASVLLQLAIQYRTNYWSRDFFDAFGRRDAEGLQRQALIFLPLTCLSILMAVGAVWARMTFTREWRAWLTRHLIDRWLAKDVRAPLHFPAGEDQNPEFRIAEDARVATDAPLGMAVGFFMAMLSAGTFIGILWSVGGDLNVVAMGGAFTIPKYLVLAVVAYSAVLTLAMSFAGRRLLQVIAAKNAAEAQFRSIGSHLRDGLDPAWQGEGHGHAFVAALGNLVSIWRRLCFQFMRTTFVSHANGLLAPVIAWILCAPKYMTGAMTLGEVAQATGAFITVQASLNWFVENYSGLADCLSSVNRVAALLVAFDGRDAADAQHSTAGSPTSHE